MSEIRTIPPQLTRDQWNALLDHALEKPASYIIRNNNGTIEAINGSTGKIDYSGTDASTVIQSAINALTNGGKIFIKAGTYTFSNTVNINYPNIKIAGEGMTNTVFIISATFTGTRLFYVNDVNDTEFDHFRIYGQGAAAGVSGIGTYSNGNGHTCYIHHVDIYKPTATGISVGSGFNGIKIDTVRIKDAGTNGIQYNSASDSWMSNMEINGAGTTGVGYSDLLINGGAKLVVVNSWFDFATYGIRIYGGNNIQITNCQIEEINQDGISITDTSYRCTFTNVHVRNVSKTAANVYSGIDNSGDQITLIGCSFWDANSKMKYGIKENSAADSCIYIGNRIIGAVTAPAIFSGTNHIVKQNVGYVTENSGTAVGTGSQQSIAHGCAFTPTKAQVIVSNIDDGANPYLSANPDATNIYVTAVNGKTFRWEVKYNP